MKNYPDQATWYDTWVALVDFHRKGKGTSPPPDPIRLEVWPFASDTVKERRWEATAAWAYAHGVEELLLGSLDEGVTEGLLKRLATDNVLAINPFFIVQDFEAAVSYYLERLGFRLDFQGPDDDRPFYGRVSRGGAGIMLKAVLPEVRPSPNPTQHEWARWDAFIMVVEPDALYEEFKQKGASFASELSAVDVGLWGFEVEDADGYVLCFARPEVT